MKNSNDEFGFLYKKCKTVKPIIISAIANIPEFMEAIRDADVSGIFWCDQTLYDVLRRKSLKMVKDGVAYHSATNIMNRISKAVTGSADTWKQ